MSVNRDTTTTVEVPLAEDWTIKVSRLSNGLWSADAYAPGEAIEGIGTCGGSHSDLRVLLGSCADSINARTPGGRIALTGTGGDQ